MGQQSSCSASPCLRSAVSEARRLQHGQHPPLQLWQPQQCQELQHFFCGLGVKGRVRAGRVGAQGPVQFSASFSHCSPLLFFISASLNFADAIGAGEWPVPLALSMNRAFLWSRVALTAHRFL